MTYFPLQEMASRHSSNIVHRHAVKKKQKQNKCTCIPCSLQVKYTGESIHKNDETIHFSQ